MTGDSGTSHQKLLIPTGLIFDSGGGFPNQRNSDSLPSAQMRRRWRKSRFRDVGYGYGFFLKEALSAGFDVYALELDENERQIAKEMTGIDAAACSFEEFDCASGSTGAVLISQVLEHALDVNVWIRKAHDILTDNGIIAIALPNFGSIFRMVMQENEPFICPPDHLNFFNANNLSNLKASRIQSGGHAICFENTETGGCNALAQVW